jgi:hypothetical protein
MSVIQFPTTNKQIDTLEIRLTEMCDQLQDDYDKMYRYYEELNAIEDRSADNEDKYNDILRAYIKLVGIENCPVGFLEYSTKARATVGDEGEIILFFEDTASEKEQEKPNP